MSKGLISGVIKLRVFLGDGSGAPLVAMVGFVESARVQFPPLDDVDGCVDSCLAWEALPCQDPQDF